MCHKCQNLTNAGKIMATGITFVLSFDGGGFCFVFLFSCSCTVFTLASVTATHLNGFVKLARKNRQPLVVCMFAS